MIRSNLQQNITLLVARADEVKLVLVASGY
jgi:hypothetical protein